MSGTLTPPPASDEVGALDKAFELIFDAYSASADCFETDHKWAMFLSGKVKRAFALMQKARRTATESALSEKQAREKAVTFPGDGELLQMEHPSHEDAFRRWALAAGLPVHMAESGLSRFHADDRTEWAWQAWCAASALVTDPTAARIEALGAENAREKAAALGLLQGRAIIAEQLRVRAEAAEAELASARAEIESAVAAEREACRQLVRGWLPKPDEDGMASVSIGTIDALAEIDAAIRARGEAG